MYKYKLVNPETSSNKDVYKAMLNKSRRENPKLHTFRKVDH